MTGKQGHKQTGETEYRRSFRTTRLSNVMTKVIKPALEKRSALEARIMSEWAQMVGEDIAAYTLPKKLRQGSRPEEKTLYIDVYESRALEVQYQLPVMLERIAAYMGCRAVSHILIHQKMEEKEIFMEALPVIRVKNPPLNEAVQIEVDAIADPELREALLALEEGIGG